VVHHGGAGTTTSALRAGVPQVLLPLLLDQHLHAHALARGGLAPAAPKLAKVTASTLRQAVRGALALSARRRRDAAERIQCSDAGAAIVDTLERAVGA
jgi:vancomycin aglycone glucosyltransferase